MTSTPALLGQSLRALGNDPLHALRLSILPAGVLAWFNLRGDESLGIAIAGLLATVPVQAVADVHWMRNLLLGERTGPLAPLPWPAFGRYVLIACIANALSVGAIIACGLLLPVFGAVIGAGMAALVYGHMAFALAAAAVGQRQAIDAGWRLAGQRWKGLAVVTLLVLVVDMLVSQLAIEAGTLAVLASALYSVLLTLLLHGFYALAWREGGGQNPPVP